ncbi:DUF6950 family protein [Mesorhizobium australicum]|uniref:DUF6950 family protein n=1 Tax=Mesorhizobium australicum TaxID=536018 RepID=UPI0033378806
MTLEEYIRLPHRWQWGFTDCTLFPADWVFEATAKDPGAELRGTYFDAEAAAAILRTSGGAERLVGAKLSPLGFHRVQTPRDGDIGIVNAMTGFDAAGARVKKIPAIRFGPLWAVMSARGVMVKSLEWTGVAWRIA